MRKSFPEPLIPDPPPGPARDHILAATPSFDPAPFAARYFELYPSAFELLRAGGVHPFDSQDFPNPYDGGTDRRDFRNVGWHSLAVGIFADRIGRHLVEKGRLMEAEHYQLVERALIHDACKRIEVLRREKLGTSLPERGAQIRAELDRIGIKTDMADQLAFSGLECRWEALPQFLLAEFPDRLSIAPGKILAKTVMLCDLMTSTGFPDEQGRCSTYFLSYLERCAASSLLERYPALRTTRLCLLPDGRMRWFDKETPPAPGAAVIGTVYAVHFWLSEAISSELKQILAPRDPLSPVEFLKKLAYSE